MEELELCYRNGEIKTDTFNIVGRANLVEDVTFNQGCKGDVKVRHKSICRKYVPGIFQVEEGLRTELFCS